LAIPLTIQHTIICMVLSLSLFTLKGIGFYSIWCLIAAIKRGLMASSFNRS